MCLVILCKSRGVVIVMACFLASKIYFPCIFEQGAGKIAESWFVQKSKVWIISFVGNGNDLWLVVECIWWSNFLPFQFSGFWSKAQWVFILWNRWCRFCDHAKYSELSPTLNLPVLVGELAFFSGAQLRRAQTSWLFRFIWPFPDPLELCVCSKVGHLVCVRNCHFEHCQIDGQCRRVTKLCFHVFFFPS